MPGQWDAGVDDYDINSAPCSDDLFKSGDDGLSVCNVNLNADCAFGPGLIQVCGEAIEFFAGQVGSCDSGAILQKPAANSVADSACCSGYEGDFIAKGQLGIVLFLAVQDSESFDADYLGFFVVVAIVSLDGGGEIFAGGVC